MKCNVQLSHEVQNNFQNEDDDVDNKILPMNAVSSNLVQIKIHYQRNH